MLCIAVGAVFEAGGLNPFDPTFTWQTALTGLGTGALNVLGWVLQAVALFGSETPNLEES